MLGREVAKLIDEERMADVYEVSWDASRLPSGVYFARLHVAGKSIIHKMLLMK